ncbi:MAG: TldD/PmbA family protein [Solirubrobacteraceae bacterium]|nr:TldD/PmbA family protein [Solirubrobacteraceae bacterium]
MTAGPADGPLVLLRELLDATPRACDYAEARYVARASESVRVRNGLVEAVDTGVSEGVGVRVRADGRWGFAATRDVTRAGIEAALAQALLVARAGPRSADAAAHALADAPAPAAGHWASPCVTDPLTVPVEDKLALLLGAEAALRSDPRIARGSAETHAVVQDWALATTDGAACTQRRTECGAGLQALAIDGDVTQTRSYPSAHGGDIALAGWEHVLALDLAGAAGQVRDEALELLSAPPCPAGRSTVILGGEQMALQIHESIGHALELDRILLGEAAYAGASWVGATDIGALRYGSDELTVTADATIPGALGSYGWDDEGVDAVRATLIEDGVLRATLSDRTSAGALGLPVSGGCARADGFARQPIVRMTNVSIEPGSAGTLDDLIAATDDGLLLETNRSWSIDDRRLHFQFGCETAREIRNGKLGRLLRDPSYAGITPAFWGSLDAVCSAPAWRVWGVMNCGKGEPGQVMPVGHGTAPARFRDVEVGVA